MEETIFTKIIKGEVPCHKVYEDELTFAFLDIHPKTPGHTLVISKKQVEFVWDLDDETYQAVMATVKKLAIRIRDIIGKNYVGEMVVGDEIPHVHVHVFPFNSMDEYRRIPDPDAEPNHKALAEMAERLRF